MVEQKSIPFELKDINPSSRTAIIAHAAYGNIDRVGDISTKGMFNSSWQRKDAVDFLFNHNNNIQPAGSVLRTFEDENKAYTEVKFGDWSMGNDMMAMIEAKVMKGASFGYETEKKDYIEKNGRKIRVLKQVKHIETSLLTVLPANPLAGIVTYNKSAENDLIAEIKQHIENMDAFCRNSNASDQCILNIQTELKAALEIISQYDTSSTPPITDRDASRTDNDRIAYKKQLTLINLQLSA